MNIKFIQKKGCTTKFPNYPFFLKLFYRYCRKQLMGMKQRFRMTQLLTIILQITLNSQSFSHKNEEFRRQSLSVNTKSLIFHPNNEFNFS
jgi:hypothetical protein